MVGAFEYFARKSQKIKVEYAQRAQDPRLIAYLLLHGREVVVDALCYVLSPRQYAEAEEQIEAVLEDPEQLLQNRAFSDVSAPIVQVPYEQAAYIDKGSPLARSVGRLVLTGGDPAISLPVFPQADPCEFPKDLLPDVLLLSPRCGFSRRPSVSHNPSRATCLKRLNRSPPWSP